MFIGKRLALGALGVFSALVMGACDAGVTEPVSVSQERALLARKVKPTEPAPTPTPAPAPAPPPPSTAAFADGFETGARAASQNGYGWTQSQVGAGDAVSVANGIARTGAYSLKFTNGGNLDRCDDSFSEQRFALGENLKEVWFEYYVFIPNGATTAGPKFYHRAVCATANDPQALNTNNKFFALWDTNYHDIDVTFLLEYRRSTTGADGDSYLTNLWGATCQCGGYVMWREKGEGIDTYGSFITDAMRGRWVQVRIHGRVADSFEASNGVVEVWIDGVKRINNTGLPLVSRDADARNYFRNGYIMGWSNSGFDQTTSMYVDDFQIFRSSPGW